MNNPPSRAPPWDVLASSSSLMEVKIPVLSLVLQVGNGPKVVRWLLVMGQWV